MRMLNTVRVKEENTTFKEATETYYPYYDSFFYSRIDTVVVLK